MVLSDHFWGVNSYFVLISSTKIDSMILGKTPPKAMEWGWAAPPHTEKVRSFVTFLLWWLPLSCPPDIENLRCNPNIEIFKVQPKEVVIVTFMLLLWLFSIYRWRNSCKITFNLKIYPSDQKVSRFGPNICYMENIINKVCCFSIKILWFELLANFFLICSLILFEN